MNPLLPPLLLFYEPFLIVWFYFLFNISLHVFFFLLCLIYCSSTVSLSVILTFFHLPPMNLTMSLSMSFSCLIPTNVPSPFKLPFVFYSNPFLSMHPCLPIFCCPPTPPFLSVFLSSSSWQPYSKAHCFVKSREPCPAPLQTRLPHQLTCP